MKKYTIVAFALLISFAGIAQVFAIKLFEFTGTQAVGAGWDGKPGKELNTFLVPAGSNQLRMYIKVPVTDYKKADAPHQLRLMVNIVNNGQVQNILSQYWNPLRRDSTLVSECFFPAGEATISLVDGDDLSKVYAKRVITVKGNGAKGNIAENGFAYDRTKFKIWTCKDVDEATWKPIGPTSKITAGSCIVLFFDSEEKIKNPGTLRWKIYRTDATGKEVFVNQRDQNSKLGEFRRMYYEECQEFTTKGKYTIYLAVKNESEAYYGVKDKDYYAKVDLVVD